MASFLQLLAKDIIRKYGTDFADLTIIFPNKRAGLFLAEELSRQIDRPVWMPEILTLTEYIEKHSGLKKAETLSLIIKLYKSYTAVSGSSEKFEDFYFWGNMLLADFDDIDKYLVDAKESDSTQRIGFELSVSDRRTNQGHTPILEELQSGKIQPGTTRIPKSVG